MSNNIFYFIRHAETQRNSGEPSFEWGSSALGEKQAQEIAMGNIFDRWDRTGLCAWGKVIDGKVEKDIAG